ncbi:hypothetical protein BC834DRAFT_848293 [Gloeopeniophorella convolvens]|nr:hypothetical protein BC834DRAFT_848293 [Gloeopeniophorella convolvens]
MHEEAMEEHCIHFLKVSKMNEEREWAILDTHMVLQPIMNAISQHYQMVTLLFLAGLLPSEDYRVEVVRLLDQLWPETDLMCYTVVTRFLMGFAEKISQYRALKYTHKMNSAHAGASAPTIGHMVTVSEDESDMDILPNSATSSSVAIVPGLSQSGLSLLGSDNAPIELAPSLGEPKVDSALISVANSVKMDPVVGAAINLGVQLGGALASSTTGPGCTVLAIEPMQHSNAGTTRQALSVQPCVNETSRGTPEGGSITPMAHSDTLTPAHAEATGDGLDMHGGDITGTSNCDFDMDEWPKQFIQALKFFLGLKLGP